ncbi:coth protein-domain-containing protein [Zychaea mexicana]|uniref:coth protein-domain-containing protein n=1 Tax=Zychaea mexicana TaxID=64656 RepID=UPI0022FEDE81|nr:coth protein-domain-containing protein [Zychaea mexicana]KAI9484702.1 coth protein-domain-containing protein [Zychaea mexicana]
MVILKRTAHPMLLLLLLYCTAISYAQDVQYAVIAFLPEGAQSVVVSVDGTNHPLGPSQQNIPNVYTGTAPAPAETYNYAILDGQGNVLMSEATPRRLANGDSSGNEFFNRTTLHQVPELPQAYHPIYPPLFSNMNKSDEIATIIMQANMTAVNEILSDPKGDHEYALVESMTYINSRDAFTFRNSGFRNSGKSSKEFTRQSFKIKLNEYTEKGAEKQLLYGRTTVKLRAQPADPTMMREKLAFDCLAAAGAATLGASWTRLFVNGQPMGLYLMIDDATTSFIDNVLHGGDHDYPHTGPTYKGNAITPQEEGNLVYHGDNIALYPESMYELEDEGANGDLFPNKSDEIVPLIGFMRDLSNVELAQDAENRGNLGNLMDNSHHTLLHLAINFLSGAWDGLWHQASNYYLNQNLESKRWTMITYDYDEVFGIGVDPSVATTPYQNFSRANSSRPFIDVHLESPYYRGEFEKILQTIVKRYFKPSIIDARLDAWRTMLQADQHWNLELPARSPGTINTTWTIWNFENNIENTDGQVMGIKEWVRNRSAAVCEQLSFTDEDDLPPLGPYNAESRPPANEQTELKPSAAVPNLLWHQNSYCLVLTALAALFLVNL